MSTVGDVSRLIEAVRKSVEREAEARIEEARVAAEQLLRRSFEEALASALRRVEEEARRLKDRLAAIEASKTVELRKAVSKAKADVVEELMPEVFTRFKEVVGEEAYLNILERLVDNAVRVLKPSKLVLIPVERDRGLVEKVAERMRARGVNVEVSGESVEGLGGFMAYNPDTGVRVDYRVEEVFSQAFEEARAVVLRTLFGQKTG